MISRKALIIWITVLAILANTGLAGTCLCGEACTDGLLSNPGTKVHLPIHRQCSDSSCNSCNLERFQSVKEVNTIKETRLVKCFVEVFVANAFLLHDAYPHDHFNKTRSFCCVAAISPSPIYLLNLAFLC